MSKLSQCVRHAPEEIRAESYAACLAFDKAEAIVVTHVCCGCPDDNYSEAKAIVGETFTRAVADRAVEAAASDYLRQLIENGATVREASAWSQRLDTLRDDCRTIADVFALARIIKAGGVA